jgi:hypothetical protein
MPTQATIAITPGSGQLLDAVSLVIGLNTVVRETMVIADPSNATQLATVTPGGALNVSDSSAEASLTTLASTVSAGKIQVSSTQVTSPWIVAGGGTAGTAATGVVTVQGIASMTPLLVTSTFSSPQHVIVDSGTITAVTSITNPVAVTSDGTFEVVQDTAADFNATVVGTGTFAVQEATLDAALIAQEATTSGIKGLTVFGAVTTAAPTYTTGKSDALSLDTAGNLRVVLNAETSKVIGTVNQGTSPWVVSGTVAVSNFPATQNVAGTLTHNNAAPASTNNLGVLPAIANAAAPTFTEGDQVLLSTNLTGAVRSSAEASSGTVSAFTTFSGSIGAVATAVKVSAGRLYGWEIFNSNVSTIYVQFFNLGTGSITLGATAPFFSLGIPAGAAANVFAPVGIGFSTAISFAITTTRTGAVAPTNTVDVNFWYF